MENDLEKIKAAIRQNLDKVPGEFISRDQLGEVSGGTLNPRHAANLDSQGKGIPRGFYLGRRRCYLKDEVYKFLVGRIRLEV